jgi:hypothetical protein
MRLAVISVVLKGWPQKSVFELDRLDASIQSFRANQEGWTWSLLLLAQGARPPLDAGHLDSKSGCAMPGPVIHFSLTNFRLALASGTEIQERDNKHQPKEAKG